MKLHNVDCRVAMRTMQENSKDTIITDPPYGLNFMGRGWDHGVPGKEFWIEALRVAKPGAMLMAFGGPRTYHRLACAIEDAGWILRDCVFWAYGQGFPKGQNLGKSTGLDEWDGWNTALKPAVEPIALAMKPLDGTFAQNVEKWGVAGLWIDGCRIRYQSEQDKASATPQGECTSKNSGAIGAEPDVSREMSRVVFERPEQNGRYPANLIHDGSPEVLACFPDSKGQLATASTSDTQRAGQNVYGNMQRGSNGQEPRCDSGSAARFFYCAKAAKSERNLGCDHLYWRKEGKSFVLIPQPEWESLPGPQRRQGNIHPTVKPLSLMRYLCRLTRTPTGGTVLDPFMGSGSTGVAAIDEGRDFIGIDSGLVSYIIAGARTQYALQRKTHV